MSITLIVFTGAVLNSILLLTEKITTIMFLLSIGYSLVICIFLIGMSLYKDKVKYWNSERFLKTFKGFLLSSLFYLEFYNLYLQLSALGILDNDYYFQVWLFGFILSLFPLPIYIFNLESKRMKHLRGYLVGFTTSHLLIILIFRIFYGTVENDDPVKNFAILISLAISILVGFITLLLYRERLLNRELFQSREKYKFLFESAPIGIGSSNLAGKSLENNEGTCKMLGYSKSEMLNLDLKKTYVNPLDREKIMSKVLKDGLVENYELKRKRKDGSICHQLVNIKLTNLGGETVILNTTLDISDRKLAEERYKFLFESAPIGIGTSTLTGKNLESNRKSRETHGYTKEELSSINAKETYTDPLDREILIKKLFEEGTVENYEIRKKRKDGSIRHLLINAKLTNLEGETVIVNTSLDITERKLAEEKYKLLFEKAPIGIGTSNEEGQAITLNQKMSELMGITPTNIDSISLENTYASPEDRKKIIEDLNEFGFIKNKEVERIRPDGTKYTMLANIDRIDIDQDNIFLTTALDITKQKELEKEKEKLEQERNRFFEIASHELKKPITNVVGALEIIKAKNPDLSRNEFLQIIDRNINKLIGLSEDLADIAKIERKVFVLEKEKINFDEFLNTEMENYSSLLGDQFEFKPLERRIITEIDKARISQVFANILDNAIQNTSQDKRSIKVQSYQENGYIVIEVEDNGAGIKKENLELIFDQFITIPTKFSAKGTGVGLYIVKTIIEEHGGSISVFSEGEDKGAKFSLRIPYIE